MTNPRAARGRGRKDPGLLTGDGTTEPEPNMLATHAMGETELSDDLLDTADPNTMTMTLAVDFGDGRTNFVGYRASSRLREGESHADLADRLVEAAQEGAMKGIEGAEQVLTVYYQAVSDREERVQRVTGG